MVVGNKLLYYCTPIPVADQMYGDDHQPEKTGRKILSSSDIGSPRWYNGQFQPSGCDGHLRGVSTQTEVNKSQTQ